MRTTSSSPTPINARDYLINAAIDIHRHEPEFGYRFIDDELDAAAYVVSERRVWRLYSAAGESRSIPAHEVSAPAGPAGTRGSRAP